MDESPPRVRIVHCFNPLAPPAGSDLNAAQPLTFESVRRAIAMAADVAEVEAVSTCFADEEHVVPTWMRKLEPLDRSIADLHPGEINRRLPLLADLFDRFGTAGDDFDIGIYSNIDIAVMPHFYRFIAERWNLGFRSMVINRRIVDIPPEAPTLDTLYTALGRDHQGHDCFVFPWAAVPNFRFDEVCLGAPPVGKSMFWVTQLSAQPFREYRTEHLTFHLGDDKPWRTNRNDALWSHNIAAAERQMSALDELHGPEVTRGIGYSSFGRPQTKALLSKEGKRIGGSATDVNQMIVLLSPPLPGLAAVREAFERPGLFEIGKPPEQAPESLSERLAFVAGVNRALLRAEAGRRWVGISPGFLAGYAEAMAASYPADRLAFAAATFDLREAAAFLLTQPDTDGWLSQQAHDDVAELSLAPDLLRIAAICRQLQLDRTAIDEFVARRSGYRSIQVPVARAPGATARRMLAHIGVEVEEIAGPRVAEAEPNLLAQVEPVIVSLVAANLVAPDSAG